MKKVFSDLLKKYDIPVPRYTSYPTVPHWQENPSTENWISSLKASLSKNDNSWSLYIHIPYCETLCTFCGCNTIITKDHKLETPYIDSVHAELSLYLKQVPELKKRKLHNIHLGGGTPTFLSPESLVKLLKPMMDQLMIDPASFEGSIEVDPRRTTKEQLKVLRELGFNRVSLGVQDFNIEVQKLINRIQPFDETQKITVEARELGYESVNFDLIYGLPKQNLENLKHTLEQTLKLRPDRIAFYSFALVPWIKPAQRLFKDSDLPVGDEKRQLYEYARQEFEKAGYRDIGMDHFALESESLSQATRDKKLHRNFMGYTDVKTDVLLGLGVSSISESQTMFHQNEKLWNRFSEKINLQQLASHKGYELSQRDVHQRSVILQMMTGFELSYSHFTDEMPLAEVKPYLEKKMQVFIEDGFVKLESDRLTVTEEGRPFIRNIGSVFDDYYKNPFDASTSSADSKDKSQTFSKSI